MNFDPGEIIQLTYQYMHNIMIGNSREFTALYQILSYSKGIYEKASWGTLDIDQYNILPLASDNHALTLRTRLEVNKRAKPKQLGFGIELRLGTTNDLNYALPLSVYDLVRISDKDLPLYVHLKFKTEHFENLLKGV